MNKQQREELLETLELDRNGDLDPDFKRYWRAVEDLCAYADQLETAQAASLRPGQVELRSALEWLSVEMAVMTRRFLCFAERHAPANILPHDLVEMRMAALPKLTPDYWRRSALSAVQSATPGTAAVLREPEQEPEELDDIYEMTESAILAALNRLGWHRDPSALKPMYRRGSERVLMEWEPWYTFLRSVLYRDRALDLRKRGQAAVAPPPAEAAAGTQGATSSEGSDDDE